MNTKFLAAAAFVAFGLSATSALASTTICSVATTVGNTTTGSCSNGTESVSITTVDETGAAFASILPPTGFTMVDNFDTIQPTAASGFTASGGTIQAHPGNPSTDANPPGDDSADFESVEQNSGSWVLTDNNGVMTGVSFYMGSPDNYNGLSLTLAGALGTLDLAGAQIWGGTTPAGNFGNQSDGYLVTLRFTPDAVKTLTFSSTQNSFEFDNVAVSVPEPASWALMIMGFGAAGGLLRSQRRKATVA